MEKQNILKAGVYYVGDPCYIFDEHWHDIIPMIDKGVQTFNYNEFIAGGTYSGDGSYYDQLGNEYWVDSGCLSIIPVDLLHIDNKKNINSVMDSEGMHIYTFDKDFTVLIEDGIFHFGHLIINTQDEDEEEENDYDY